MATSTWETAATTPLAVDGDTITAVAAAIPVFPNAVTEFLGRCESADVGVCELAKTIESDSQVVASLLKRVNSSAAGRRERATNLTQAMTTLGIRRTRQLLIEIAVLGTGNGASRISADSANFLSANYERAIFAELTAAVFGADRDIAYLGALLQDWCLPALDALGMSLDSEADHAEIGCALLKRWNLPHEVTTCVRFHHAGLSGPELEGFVGTALECVQLSSMLPGWTQSASEPVRSLLEQIDGRFELFELASEVDRVVANNPHYRMRTPLVDRIEAGLIVDLEKTISFDSHVGRRIDKYRIEQRIGSGTNGAVYLATHVDLERECAVKVLNPEIGCGTTDTTLKKEARAMSKLQHENIVEVYDFGVAPFGHVYYVMEYVDGWDLHELVRVHGPQPESRVVDILTQTAQALTVAHSRGLIHRDIKPSNILLTTESDSDLVKLADFGLVVERTNEAAASFAGTPQFAAPETILPPHAYDERSDIFSLGGVGAFLLTGRAPWPGSSFTDVMRLVRQSPKHAALSAKGQSSRLRRLLAQCLAFDASERPRDARSVFEELRQVRVDCEYPSVAEFADGESESTPSTVCSVSDEMASTHLQIAPEI